jgi:hypothetical protein
MNDEKLESQNTEDLEKNNSAFRWDESRIIVLLIGISLIIESLLIYYQAGVSQFVVAGVTGVAVRAKSIMIFSQLKRENLDKELFNINNMHKYKDLR